MDALLSNSLEINIEKLKFIYAYERTREEEVYLLNEIFFIKYILTPAEREALLIAWE